MTLGNLANILAQVSLTSIIAVGLTFVILTGEIDLSVAAVANAIGVRVPYMPLTPDRVLAALEKKGGNNARI